MTNSAHKAGMSASRLRNIIYAIAAASLLSSCTYLRDWSLLHHLRLYERYRLIANHELAEGDRTNAVSDLKKALEELELARPKDENTRVQSALALGGMYLACGDSKSAIDCYQQTDNGTFLAESTTGKGFCFLAQNKKDEAASEFRRALQLFKANPTTPKTNPYPIDYCPSCCIWGLAQSKEKSDYPIKVSLVEDHPLPSECLTSRLILTDVLERRAKEHATTSGTKQPRLPAVNQIPNGKLELQKSWNTLFRAGKRCSERNDYEQAERYFKSALNLLRRNDENDVRLTESLQTLSSFYLGQERIKEAIPYLEEEVALKRARFGNDDIALIDPIRRFGFACMRDGNYPVADKAMTEALAISIRQNRENELTARICSNFCELRVAQGRFKEAEALGRKSLEILNKVCPANDYRLAVPHFMLAKSLIGQNRIAEAEHDILMSTSALDNPDVVASVKLDMLLTGADLAVRRGDGASARSFTRAGRELVDKIGPPRPNQGRVIFDRLMKRLQHLESTTQKEVR